MKKENMKLFVRKHRKEIVLIGGIVVFTIVVAMVRKALNSQTDIEDHDVVIKDDALPDEGYDIWAMIGTKCSQELLSDIEALVQKENKTIYFDHYEIEED